MNNQRKTIIDTTLTLMMQLMNTELGEAYPFLINRCREITYYLLKGINMEDAFLKSYLI